MPILPDHRLQALRGLGYFASEVHPHTIGINRGFEPNRNDIIDFQTELLTLANRVDRVVEAYGEYLESIGVVTSQEVHDYFRHQLHNALTGNATYCIERGIEKRLENA